LKKAVIQNCIAAFFSLILDSAGSHLYMMCFLI
jgi:hypothetical protein